MWPRNPGTPGPRPRSVPISDAPVGLLPGSESSTGWTPFAHTVPEPYLVDLPFSMMGTELGSFYDASPNPFPANGVDDQPNARFDVFRLEPTTSAHPGLSLSTGPGPTMIFTTPPVWGLQTVPIYATGA